MMASEKMVRVNRNNPCPICHKYDWCLVAIDGSAAICPRIQEGSVKKCGQAGWLHRFNDTKFCRSYKTFTRSISISIDSNSKDFAKITRKCQCSAPKHIIADLGLKLSLSINSLNRLGVGWSGAGYTFPMSNASRKIIGLHMRYLDGHKACMKGSRLGLFIPVDLPEDEILLVCEGASDTATALDLGFAAIGRTSCNTGKTMLSRFARGRSIVIIGDGDKPGRRGAESLASYLVAFADSIQIIFPPSGIKDLRQWKIKGLTKDELKFIIGKTFNHRICVRKSQV